MMSVAVLTLSKIQLFIKKHEDELVSLTQGQNLYFCSSEVGNREQL